MLMEMSQLRLWMLRLWMLLFKTLSEVIMVRLILVLFSQRQSWQTNYLRMQLLLMLQLLPQLQHR
jgi:hypothetical protein